MMKIFKSKIARNANWIILSQIMKSIIALIVGLLTARYLGPSNYGLISYASSLISFILPLMQLGLTSILVQELTNHPDEEGKIIGTSICLSVLSAIFCIACVNTYTFIVDNGEPITNIVVCLYSIIIFTSAFELIQYWFQAKLLSKYVSIISLCSYLIVSVYKFYLLFTGKSVYWFAVSNSIDYCLIVIGMLIVYFKLGGQRLRFSSPIAKRMLKSSKHYIIPFIMISIYVQTDKIMIKSMINETHVGYYSAALTCGNIASFVYTAIADSFRPIIFQAKKSNDDICYEKNLIRLTSIVFYLAFFQSLFFTFFAPLIVNLLFGQQYASSILALRIIVWCQTFSYLGTTRNIWVLAENKQRYLWITSLIGIIVNICLNYAFIPIWGIYGAAIASLITQIFTNIVVNVIVYPLKHYNYYILKSLNPKHIISIIK